jgi:hypothetical protein
MSNKPIYQPWSEEEFSADVDVQAMSPIQRWMYRTLCQKAFVCTTRPFPPNDDAILWKLAGCPSIAFWNQHKGPVREMFAPREIDGVQVLFRQRLADDWSKLQSIREAKKRGAEARWDGERMHMHSTADALHSTAMQGSKEVSKDINSKDKTRAEPGRGTLPDQEQKRKIDARDSRLEKEDLVRKETQIGKGPVPSVGVTWPGYIEFDMLRATRKIGRHITWDIWKKLSPSEREGLIEKPGPAAVQLELTTALAKRGG